MAGRQGGKGGYRRRSDRGGFGLGGPGRLVEEAVIGTEARGEEDLLGDVVGIDVASDRIYIADPIVPTVRVYDWNGNHIMNIGRHGGGPGEFYSVTDVGIDRVRNELVVMENSGITHRLTPAGEYLSRSNKVGQGTMAGADLLLRVRLGGAPMVRQLYLRVDREARRITGVGEAFFTLDSAGVPGG